MGAMDADLTNLTKTGQQEQEGNVVEKGGNLRNLEGAKKNRAEENSRS